MPNPKNSLALSFLVAVWAIVIAFIVKDAYDNMLGEGGNITIQLKTLDEIVHGDR